MTVCSELYGHLHLSSISIASLFPRSYVRDPSSSLTSRSISVTPGKWPHIPCLLVSLFKLPDDVKIFKLFSLEIYNLFLFLYSGADTSHLFVAFIIYLLEFNFCPGCLETVLLMVQGHSDYSRHMSGFGDWRQFYPWRRGTVVHASRPCDW